MRYIIRYNFKKLTSYNYAFQWDAFKNRRISIKELQKIWKFNFIIPSQKDRFKSRKYRSYRDKEKTGMR